MKIMDMKGAERKKKQHTILRCPQCGSDNITYELGLITGYKYFCKNCQYVGPLVIQETGEKEQGARREAQGAGSEAGGARDGAGKE